VPFDGLLECSTVHTARHVMCILLSCNDRSAFFEVDGSAYVAVLGLLQLPMSVCGLYLACCYYLTIVSSRLCDA